MDSEYSEKTALIVGCGFLGEQVAKCLSDDGWQVTGATHSLESADRLKHGPFKVVTFDVGDAASLKAAGLPSSWSLVLHCASSGRGGAEAYRHVYLQGMRNLIDTLSADCMLFTSSTSVYAQNDGSTVTETSEAAPDRETGQYLRAAEEETLKAGGCVARVAGLYGPARSVLLRKFFDGSATIEGTGDRWINQIHRDDAASALVTIAKQHIAGRATGIYNAVDNDPTSQRAVYQWMAAHFSRPLPPEGEINMQRKRGVTHKRVSNTRLRELGWEPAFPSFHDAILRDPRLMTGLNGETYNGTSE